MKIFLSYRFTGEDLDELEERIGSICSSLKKAGHTSFCSLHKEAFFKTNSFSAKQILDYTLNELNDSDYVLAFVKSPEKSEGMLLELGYALAKSKKIILAIKKGVHSTFLPHIADQIIEFDEFDELYKKLETVTLS